MASVTQGGTPGAARVDLHTHLMPGVDDGVRDRDGARRALGALARAGVAEVAATPHLRGSVLGEPDAAARRLGELDRAWEALREVATLDDRFPTIRRGAEVRLDATGVDLSDERVRLGGGRAVLVEFARLELPPYGARQLGELTGAGWRPVLAHAERYRGLEARIGVAERWREAGAHLQVNAGSLVGHYGPGPRAAARKLLERGWVDLLASDFHGVGSVGLEEAAAALAGRDADGDRAHLLLARNPRRILVGEVPVPVPPLPERGGWERLVDFFRR